MAKSKTVAANKKPKKTTGLAAPTRSGMKFSAKWSKPSTSSTDAKRATGQERQWRKCVLVKGKKGEKNPGKIGHHYRKLEDVTSISTSTTSSSFTLTRKDYYPYRKKNKKGKIVRCPKLHKILFRVRNKNSKTGDWTQKEYVFKPPVKPTITISYDESKNEISMTVNGKQDSDKTERIDTIIEGSRKDSGDTGSDRGYQKKWTDLILENGEELDDKEFKDEEKTYKHRITNPQLPQGSKIHIKVSATNRGFMGDSDSVTAHYIIRPPYVPAVKRIRVLTGGTELSGNSLAATKRKYLSNGNGRVLIDFGYAKKIDTSDETADHDSVRTQFSLERLISEEWQDQAVWASTASGWKENIDTYEGATSDRLKGHATANDWATIGESTINVVSDMGEHMYGHHVWYRIKAERQGMVVYSAPVEATAFYIPTPSAENDKSGFIYIANGSDGKTINTVVGWDDPNITDEMYDDPEYRARGEWTTVIGYSEHKDAIKSNKKPEEISIDWKTIGNYNDYAPQDISKDKIHWNETAECAIHDLECGVPYYLWVKRHVEMDDLKESQKNSKWQSAPEGYFPFTPTDNPTSININTPEVFIPLEGNALNVAWTHNAVSEQKSWAVFLLALPANYVDKIGNDSTTGNAHMLAEKIPVKTLVSGTGAVDSTPISYETLVNAFSTPSVVVDGMTMSYGSLENGGTIYIGVGVSTGGAMVLSYATAVGAFSGANAVTVASVPDCAIYVDDTITSQPVYAYIFTNDPTANYTFNATSSGASVSYPDGDYDQADGDYVWTRSGTSMEWHPTSDFVPSSNFESFSAFAKDFGYVVELVSEGTLEFLQNGQYEFTAHTVNSYTDLLRSEAQVATASVSYTRDAEPAGGASRCETRNVNGTNPYVEIYCAKPSNWTATDHAIVYRVTPDGAYPIATDVKFGTVVVDEYPPFSKVASTHYAVATVTEDGMVAIREIPYALKRHGLRFDWGDNRILELPYNIELSDDFQKDNEVRAHQDGTVNSYWNPAITRTLTANSVIIKQVEIYDAETFELVREMAHYPGPVLVRAHNGVCFMADVQVNGLSDSYENLTSPVSLTCTEITLTEQFMAHNYHKYNEELVVSEDA